ncbi:hypothetical protein ASPWEDRAFT_690164 [Aspergillus wentii DTO 134E9]|uniref:Uncharacterized protein n=1 Tax=Aspergillus wentii DTO 134E9 TaxID=1073089 RepID=A0A1L9R8S2_ASPWE|nr:uncharacterized protein ASPWEDRAFT_690164 [Aspergillus wentii DTO 134E9]OJJ31320.1 hypothetical protein ASPWEDRAFT_690164 [Aspergillus wentii DTO 134E9]
MVDLLLKAGANINIPAMRYKGPTALQVAASGEHEHIMQMLLDNGADFNAAGSYYNGLMAVSATAACEYLHTVKTSLISGNKNWRPVQIAAFRDILKFFVFYDRLKGTKVATLDLFLYVTLPRSISI